VWGIRGEIAEERSLALHRLDPLRRLSEKDIGAVTVCLLKLAVVEDGRVEIAVARSIATAAGVTLADTAGTVNEHLVKSAFVGPVIGLVTKVPFAEDAGRVTGRLQNLGESRSLEGQALAFQDGVGDAVAEFVTAGHQRRARRRAGRADVEVGEANALIVKAVEVRCLQNRITVTGQVAITLVIRQEKNNIRLPGPNWFRRVKRTRGQQSKDDHRRRNLDNP
jgi:hypothetical protein